MTNLILPQAQKNRNTLQRDRAHLYPQASPQKRAGTPQSFPREAAISPQLALFDTQPAKARRHSGKPAQRLAAAVYATESETKQPGGGRWWNIRCSYNRKMFGGLYSIAERDIILKAFDGRTTPVELDDFEVVAKYAMKMAVRGVAA